VKKIWLMAKVTYRRRIRSSTFLILTFAVPVLMVIVGAIAIIQETSGGLSPVGYVDQTDQLAPVNQIPVDGELFSPTAYADVAAARGAYRRGEVAGYLVIPAGYFDGQPATFYAQDAPNSRLEQALMAFMRRAMLPDAPAWALDRLADPVEMTYVDQGKGTEIVAGPALLIRVAVPVALALMFAFAVLTGASQMGSVIVREKDQRAMEMVVTSLAPRELVVGKVLGMTCLSLTQIGIWLLGAAIAAGLALSGRLDIQELSIPWEAVVWALLLGVPGYFLYAILASGLGIIAGDSQQAQQLAGVLGFVGLVPLWFLTLLVEAPQGPLAVALTLFPLTGPMIALFRIALSDVPTWQLLGSFTLIVLSLSAGAWIVSRIFRAAMLMYGQSLHPGQIWQALREA
jgi:ABC-2 type transport system permease protein